MKQPVDFPIWQKLIAHHRSLASTTLRDLFAKDNQRFDRFQLDAAGIFLDYSKNHVTDLTRDLLLQLAVDCQAKTAINHLFAGDIVNASENRPALHTALRNQSGDPVWVDGHDVMPPIQAVLSRLKSFSDSVRDATWVGFTQKPVTDVVNIGIGGSDLGPLMATEALKPFAHPRLSMHFVSNVDASHLVSTLASLQPETTLFIVVSKTFTTQETLSNAHSARQWFLESGAAERDIAKHFVAVSSNPDKVAEFGIDVDNMFEFWNWVGGRYSVWSAVGLSLILSIGMDRFDQFLGGAHKMDQHFRNAPMERNMPVMLALLSIWYNNFFTASTHLIAPYDQSLHRFPAYLQQLNMESNGKSVHTDGTPVSIATGPIVWGEPGTNGQHAFFQLLHQGTHKVPIDFILPLESLNPMGAHHDLLMANCFAQSEALMMGKDSQTLTLEMDAAGASVDEIDRLLGHRTFSGNSPSNTLLLHRLDAHTLGALIALYEHKVFIEAVIWNINPFDQWGVELGKQLAKSIYQEISGGDAVTGHDCSTNGLINRALKLRNLYA